MKGADVISTPFLDSSPRAPKHLFLFFYTFLCIYMNSFPYLCTKIQNITFYVDRY